MEALRLVIIASKHIIYPNILNKPSIANLRLDFEFFRIFEYEKNNTLCGIAIPILEIILPFRETGLDCDYVIEGESKEEVLINGADHFIMVHG